MGDDGRDEEAFLSFIGLLNVHINKPSSTKYKEFEDQVRLKNRENPFNDGNYSKIDVHAGSLYDAIYLYAIGLNKTILSGGNEFNGSLIIQNILNSSFEGKIFK